MLQEGEIERLWGTQVKVDLRLVRRDQSGLRAAVREGLFREDLYYRLNVIAFRSTLREDRRDDVPLLAEHFLQIFTNRNARHLSVFRGPPRRRWRATTGRATCASSSNTVERAVVLSRGTPSIRRSLARGSHGSSSARDGKSLTFRGRTRWRRSSAGLHAPSPTRAATSACAPSCWASRRGPSTGGSRAARGDGEDI